MRAKAKKILYDKLKYEGMEEVLFPSCKMNETNSVIETIIDAMIAFNATSCEPKIKGKCRLHTVRKNCRSYKNIGITYCKTCPHNIVDDQIIASKRIVKTHPKSNPETIKAVEESLKKRECSSCDSRYTQDDFGNCPNRDRRCNVIFLD